MAAHNPAYQELLIQVEKAFASLGLSGRMADLGCGTGNFTLAIARACPEAKILACDLDPRMLEILAGKLDLGETRIETRRADLQERPEPENSLDAVSMVHCLYTQGREGALRTLANVHAMLKPGGYLVVSDIGRPLDLRDWTRYMARHVSRHYGWFYLLQLYLRMKAVRRENRKVSKTQARGGFYMHDLATFRCDLEAAGFEILEARDDLYRGIDDFAVARKRC